MAIAYVHSNRGEKSALIGVKATEWEFGWTHVYVPRTAVKSFKPMVEEIDGKEVKNEEYDTFQLKDGFKVVDMRDSKGEVLTSKSGEPLKVLKW